MNNKIIKQINTEKTYKLQEGGIYSFLFPRNIRKNEVKLIIEKKYSVKVDNVNIVNLPKKMKVFRGNIGTLTQYKKAYIKLARGMKIETTDNSDKQK